MIGDVYQSVNLRYDPVPTVIIQVSYNVWLKIYCDLREFRVIYASLGPGSPYKKFDI